jgi:hypothetical protein
MVLESPVILSSHIYMESQRSSVGIMTGYGLNNRGSGFQFPAGAGNFSILHCIQTGSGAHPMSYPMSTGVSFPGSTVARA